MIPDGLLCGPLNFHAGQEGAGCISLTVLLTGGTGQTHASLFIVSKDKHTEAGDFRRVFVHYLSFLSL